MSKDINKEIDEQAENMEKSQQTPKERLFATIRQLGPEGLRAKLATLEKSDQEILVAALEEMKKGASPSMDANYAASYVKGNVNDTILQEDKADDDQDEKLVDPKNAEMKHQGDNAPEGFEGQVIKGKEIDVKDDAEETADEATKKIKDTKKEDHDKKMNKSEELLEEIKKSDDMMYTLVQKMCGMGKDKKFIMDKCMSKGLDGDKVSGMIDRAVKEHEGRMHKSDEIEKGKMLKEEEQSKDNLDKLQNEKTRGDKSRPEALKNEEDNKKNMTKSAPWSSENELLKARTGGRNHHFSVNGYYDEVLAKSENEGSEEKLVKSEENKKEDINDIIEKGGDSSRDEVICKSMVEENQKKVNGRFVKSFTDNEIAQALGLTEEEAKQLLGE